MIRFALIAACALFLVGCSTVETTGGANLAALGSSDRVQLRVRTGSDQMDHLLFEMAYQQFSDVIPLRESGPFTGTLELTFASSTQGAFVGSSAATGSVSASSVGWYTGGTSGGSVTGSAISTSVTSGTVFEWQNSTMLAVLRRNDGERLWSADYSYKGGWEISGFTVNTPEEAARLVTKRLKVRYVADRGKSR
jgi:hypothetical protein